MTWADRARRSTKLSHRGPAPQDYEIPGNLPAPIEAIEYPSGDLRLKGWFVPAGAEGRAPTLVFLHGGFAWGFGDLVAVSSFHDAGFNLFTPSWRGENGNPGFHELGYGEVDDAIAAIEWVRKDPRVDPDAIFVVGHSAGGMIASLLAVVPDLPVAETASIGGIYTPEAILQFGEVPFDVSDPDEARFRSLLTFQRAMVRPHVAYVGRDDFFLRNGLGAFRALADSKLEIIDVDGDHFMSLDNGVAEYLARVLKQLGR